MHASLEPASHYFYSDRLKLQFWDWGTEGKPVLILVHGTRDHARSWDWIARALRDEYHVYALDLRGHGNSAWAPGALYSVPEHILDLTVFADIIGEYPVRLIGHSLGAMVSLYFSGTYPEKVAKLVAIEGVGVGPLGSAPKPASERMRKWIEKTRNLEERAVRTYANLAAAVARMKEANPFLTDEVARAPDTARDQLERGRLFGVEVRQLYARDSSLRAGPGGSGTDPGADYLPDAAVLGPAELRAGSGHRSPGRGDPG